jgi:hypothetical protein
MADDKAESKADTKSDAGNKPRDNTRSDQNSTAGLPGDERYQYIGFEAFGAKVGSFWKNDGERQNYLERVKQQVGSIYRNSVVYSTAIGATDRIFIAIASLAMIIAPFMTWFSVRTIYGTESFNGVMGFFNREGFWFYVEMMDGWVIPTTIYLLVALAFLSILLGILGLASTFLKAKSEAAYVGRIKWMLRLNLVPFLIFLTIIVLGMITQRIPFGEHLGVYDLGGRYSIVTLVELSSIGFWLAIFGVLLNFNKSREL